MTLAADGDRVAAAWAATGSDGHRHLRWRVSDDGGAHVRRARSASTTSTATRAPTASSRRASLLKGHAVDVVWVSKRDGVAGIRAAASTDGGRTFAPARSITPTGVTGARGWESAALGADGAVHAVWLDGRDASPPARRQPAAASSAAAADAHHHGADAAGHLSRDVERGRRAGRDRRRRERLLLLQDRGRDRAAATSSSRGGTSFPAACATSPSRARPTAAARFRRRSRVSEDNWKIDACPDDGPAMAIDADGALHVVWPTLVQDAAAARDGRSSRRSAATAASTFSPRAARRRAATAAPAHPRLATDAGRAQRRRLGRARERQRRVMLRAPGGAAGRGQQRTGGQLSRRSAATADGLCRSRATDQLETRSVVRALHVPAVRP